MSKKFHNKYNEIQNRVVKYKTHVCFAVNYADEAIRSHV